MLTCPATGKMNPNNYAQMPSPSRAGVGHTLMAMSLTLFFLLCLSGRQEDTALFVHAIQGREWAHTLIYTCNTYCIYNIQNYVIFVSSCICYTVFSHSLLCFLHEQEVIWSHSFRSFCEGLPSLNLAWHIKAATFIHTDGQTHTHWQHPYVHVATALVHTYSVQYKLIQYIYALYVYICN